MVAETATTLVRAEQLVTLLISSQPFANRLLFMSQTAFRSPVLTLPCSRLDRASTIYSPTPYPKLAADSNFNFHLLILRLFVREPFPGPSTLISL